MTSARHLVERASSTLADAGVASPAYDAEELLSHVIGVPRLRLRFLDSVPDGAARTFDELVLRRAKREPLQHLTGEAPFRHVMVKVGPGVFVPRPETEIVAGWVIETAQDVNDHPVVVDLCTGSGAIALSIATELPAARVYACELDPAAHAWAERNLAGSSVTLALGDAAEAFGELSGTVDVIVSNPPYIPMAAYESVEPEVRDHDPALALWSGPDGLDAIRVIERSAARLLKPGGWAVVEHADVQRDTAPAVFAATGAWTNVRDNPDLSGKSRFVTARRLASVEGMAR
ncbi:N5-glutamine methyltransferase family protein [Flindersiella endophytica]